MCSAEIAEPRDWQFAKLRAFSATLQRFTICWLFMRSAAERIVERRTLACFCFFIHPQFLSYVIHFLLDPRPLIGSSVLKPSHQFQVSQQFARSQYRICIFITANPQCSTTFDTASQRSSTVSSVENLLTLLASTSDNSISTCSHSCSSASRTKGDTETSCSQCLVWLALPLRNYMRPDGCD